MRPGDNTLYLMLSDNDRWMSKGEQTMTTDLFKRCLPLMQELKEKNSKDTSKIELIKGLLPSLIAAVERHLEY